MTEEMPMVDRTFPHPVMDPAKWPQPKEGRADLWVLPLELTVMAGGPWRRYAERIQESGAYAWRLSSGWERLEDDLVLREEVRSRLLLDPKEPETIFVDTDLNERDLEGRWVELWGTDLSGYQLAPADELARIRVLSWAEEIFPLLKAEMGTESFEGLVAKFGKEWTAAKRIPWDGLRFFPPFLRQETKSNEAWAELANLEWARFQALYSPQDEGKEWAALATGEVMLNPTIQIVRLRAGDSAIAGGAHARAIYRDPYGGENVTEKAIGWREAVLIDELEESARVTVKELLAHVEKDYQAPHRRLVGFSPKGSFAESLEELVASGLVLRA